jgi:hypothetical protein
MLCGLFMLAAFIAFVKGRYALFCLAATIALLLKETALTVPIAALVLAGAWVSTDRRRTVTNLIWLALPLLIWGAGRTFIFEYGRGIYVLSSTSQWGWLLKPVRNLLYLPSRLYRGPLRTTEDAIHSRDLRTLLLHGFQVAANIAWWVALLYALYRAWREFGRRWLRLVPAPWISGLVFALGTLCMVMLLQAPDPRYLYFWFALGPAALFAALANTRRGVAWSLTLSVILLVPQIFAIQRTLSADSIRNYDLVKRSGKLLTELLGNMPADVTTVFLLDDVVIQGTAPGYFAKWAGFRGRIVVLNSVTPILGCHAAPAGQSRYTLLRSASATELEYTAPDCVYALNEAPLSMFDVHNDVKRGPWMTYHFAQMQLTNPISTLSASDYDIGSHWTLAVSDPSCAVAGACVWLGLDPVSQTYYVLD